MLSCSLLHWLCACDNDFSEKTTPNDVQIVTEVHTAGNIIQILPRIQPTTMTISSYTRSPLTMLQRVYVLRGDAAGRMTYFTNTEYKRSH